MMLLGDGSTLSPFVQGPAILTLLTGPRASPKGGLWALSLSPSPPPNLLQETRVLKPVISVWK